MYNNSTLGYSPWDLITQAMKLKVYAFISTKQQYHIIQHFIHTHTRVNLQNPIFYSFHTEYNTMTPWTDMSLQSLLSCQVEGHDNLNHFSLSLSRAICPLIDPPYKLFDVVFYFFKNYSL
jgi:hypothetical protein